MRFKLFFIAILLLPTALFAQEADDDPVYVVDSVRVSSSAANNFTPDQIGLITIAKGRKAVLLYGNQAENGVVYIETKPFARKRVDQLLRTSSPSYDSLRRVQPLDSNLVYIVNDKIVTPTDEARLFTVDRRTFQSLQILSSKELEDKYHLTGKKAGVAILSTED
ncbi:hypothetical protein [Chitinophaga sp. Cy-1792]|uniref:hypothetical protein n=1 Tax=Chitinophaga sp. Cy-1792 TaxID=2608339 RepID=UPI0014215488|nr:hypothetical protein [Chitinophaga sp. Cy-1792]NIG54304.1 hypothetical protein [Chitinophaga sp. Cy-1792]